MLIALLALPSDDLLFNVSDGLFCMTSDGGREQYLDNGHFISDVAVDRCCGGVVLQ
jgi:hypothetical protein